MEIEDTNAEDFDDFEIIVTGTMLMLLRVRNTLFGDKLSNTQNMVNSYKSLATREQSRLVKVWLNIFQVATSKVSVLKLPRKL